MLDAHGVYLQSWTGQPKILKDEDDVNIVRIMKFLLEKYKTLFDYF
jgi:hypothetical protein